ncbi:hypothetical protein FGO82_01435, partial [Streptococcus pyogenes]
MPARASRAPPVGFSARLPRAGFSRPPVRLFPPGCPPSPFFSFSLCSLRYLVPPLFFLASLLRFSLFFS